MPDVENDEDNVKYERVILEGEQRDRLMELPQCPHLHRASGVCKHATQVLGAVYPTCGPMCNVTCRNEGPNLGRTLTKEQSIRWTERLFKCHYSHVGASFLYRVAKKHQMKATITLPPNVESLRAALAPLRDCPEIETLCVTGSAVASEAKWPPKKDIDIVVVIKDLDAFLDRKQEIEALLPERIDGILIDYFFNLHHSAFYVSVDLWDSTMYQSVLHTEAKPGEDITSVVRPKSTAHYDEAFQRALDSISEEDLAREAEIQKRIGLGDMVSVAIKKVSAGKIKECKGCKERRAWLNKIGKKAGIGK